jgi:deoxycytidylate deaminase
MQLAYACALRSPIKIRHGCVAVLNGKVVAQGFNHERCFSRDGLITRTSCCHAEIDAVRKTCYALTRCKWLTEATRNNRIGKILSRVTLYVARASNTAAEPDYDESARDSKSSGPCDKCMATLRALGIKQVAFISKSSEFIKCRPSEYTDYHVTAGERSMLRKYEMGYFPDADFVKIHQHGNCRK